MEVSTNQEIVGKLNIAILVNLILIDELLREQYAETRLYEYMVSQVYHNIGMIADGIAMVDVVKILEQKLNDPTFSMKGAMMNAKRHTVAS